jgi:hypothetical protein
MNAELALVGRNPVYEIADRLAQLGVPFVFATGYDESAISLWLRNRPRLQKPFRADHLMHAIDRLHREKLEGGDVADRGYPREAPVDGLASRPARF